MLLPFVAELVHVIFFIVAQGQVFAHSGWIFGTGFPDEEHKESQTAASLIRDGDRFTRASHLLCYPLLKERGLSVVLSSHPLERVCSSDDNF